MNSATGGMMSGAAQGATAGSVAGPWGAVIGGVVGGVLGLFGGSAADKARAEANIAQNKAVMKYNEKVMLSTADSVSQINMQRALESQRTSAALFNINAAKGSAESAMNMTVAANDTVGASVQDAAQSVAVSAGRAESATVRNQQNMVEGYNMLLKKTTEEGKNALQDPVEMGTNTQAYAMAGSAIGTAAGLAGSMYTKGQVPAAPAATTSAPANPGASTFDWWGKAPTSVPNLDFNTNMKTSQLGW